MPKISVIVPVYRAENYLHACVDSILSQTFADFEILLVDDGSPDHCGAICDEYASREERVTVIHQENQGQAAARNHALGKAVGEWLCYVDSDDLIHPQMLQLLYDAAMESGAPMSMCHMLEAPELPETFWERKQNEYEVLSMEESSLAALYDADRYPGWVACAKLIRRDVVDSYPFREGRVYEDNEAVCRWICQAGSIALVPWKLYFYRTNPDSTTKSTFNRKRLDYLWALESIIRHYGSIGYLQMRQRFFDRYVDAVLSGYNGMLHILKDPQGAKKVEQGMKQFLREEKLTLSKRQWEDSLNTMHPGLARLYWPAAGALRTIRDQGVAALAGKLLKKLRKDDAQ